MCNASRTVTVRLWSKDLTPVWLAVFHQKVEDTLKEKRVFGFRYYQHFLYTQDKILCDVSLKIPYLTFTFASDNDIIKFKLKYM